MPIARVVQYSDIYPEQKDNLPKVEDLICGINRAHLCTMTSNMFDRLVEQPFYDNDLDPRNEEFDYIRFFLSHNNPSFIQKAVNRYRVFLNREQRQKQNIDVKYVATTKAAVMTFQRFFFSLPPSVDRFDYKMEQDFFNALLLINQQVYDLQFDDKKHENEPPDLRLAHLFLANSYANEDIDASDLYDSFRRQLIKSVELFSFLCRDKRLKKIKERFYAHFRIGTWTDYIIPHIMCTHWMKRKSGLLLVEGKHITGRMARRILKQSSVDCKEVIPFAKNEDYTQFRGRPFIRLARNRYAITNISFVVEHIYNSLYFEFKKYRADAGFMDDDQFRTYVTTEFSQKFMFHRFARRCLHGDEVKVLDGTQCDEIVKEKQAKGVHPLDFYVRNTNSCVLFEFKDTLLSAKTKDERDPEKFFAEIRKKFVEKPDGTPKGIGQLIKNVKAIQEGSFIFDDLPSDMTIYPVLVVDNYVYTMRAMRTKLEYLMREYCRENVVNDSFVKPLILVDVATFRLYADYFSSKGFVDVFEEYYRAIQLPTNPNYDDLFNSMISFSDFMKDKQVGNMGQVFDQLIKQVGPYLRKN